MFTRPAEKFWVVMPQTPLKFLGQNLLGDHLGGRSEAGKVWPQAILGPGAMGLTGGCPWTSNCLGPHFPGLRLTPKMVSRQILA